MKKRVMSVTILKDIKLANGVKYALSPQVSIILDKKRKADSKIHELIYQQGTYYGAVGDRCTYLSHDELFELEEKGMIKIN